jgi:hypothetical protein
MNTALTVAIFTMGRYATGCFINEYPSCPVEELELFCIFYVEGKVDLVPELSPSNF